MNTMPPSFTVEIDREIESIVPEFLEKRAEDCRLVDEMLEREAFSEIRALGHRMKGAGGSYGFDDVSKLGEIIEDAALAGDKSAISKAVLELAEYLARVNVVYVDII